MSRVVTTFPAASEFEKAVASLRALGLPHEAIPAAPGYARVGAGAVIVDDEARMKLASLGAAEFVASGWVDWHEEECRVPQEPPREFDEPVFESCAVMVLAPCVAARTKIRVTAHVAGDLAPVFPYMNAEMTMASYNPHGPNFTFLDGYRMVALYPNRITVARADGIVDAWRVLEDIRRRANETWARRTEIKPSFETRERPPALEIYKRLPKTNCRACGEASCLAFAAKVWMGQVQPSRCIPVFAGPFGELKDALVDICRALGTEQAL